MREEHFELWILNCELSAILFHYFNVFANEFLILISKMEKKIVYHIIFWEEDEMIGRVMVDELKTDIIWKLFKQFGRTRTDNTSFEVKESFEE